MSFRLTELPSIERVTYSDSKQIFKIIALKMDYQKFAQMFTVEFLKLLSTHSILFVVWGNFPFKDAKFRETDEAGPPPL